MESANKGRSARSIFEMGEIHRSGWTRPSDRPNSPAEDKTSERPANVRVRNVPLSDRQITLAMGALEYVIAELRTLPGCEGAIKEYEACLYPLRQALAVLPPGESKL